MNKKRFNQVMPAFLEAKLQFAANMISDGNRTEALNIITHMALAHWDHEAIKKWAEDNYYVSQK